MRFINYLRESKSPFLPVKNQLFRKLCKSSMTGDHTSSVIRDIFNAKTEMADIVADAGLDVQIGEGAALEKKRESIKKEILKLTQQALSQRGLPDEFLVYRGGEILGNDLLVPVSLDKGAAYSFSTFGLNRGEQRPLFTFKVKKSAVVADVSAISVLRGWESEQELLVRKEDLKLVDKSITSPPETPKPVIVPAPKIERLRAKLGEPIPA